MNPTLSVSEIAKRLCHDETDWPAVAAIERAILDEVAAGGLVATLAAPTTLPSLVGSGRRSTPVSDSPKSVNGNSLVEVEVVCVWRRSEGYLVPDRLLNLLSEPARARIVDAGKVSTAVETSRQRLTSDQFLGVVLAVMLDGGRLPPALVHADGTLNVSAFGDRMRELLQEEGGELPRGYSETVTAEKLAAAVRAARPSLRASGKRKRDFM